MRLWENFLKKREAKRVELIRERLVEYYKTVQEFSIPPEILADFDIELIIKRGTVNFWYSYLVK